MKDANAKNKFENSRGPKSGAASPSGKQHQPESVHTIGAPPVKQSPGVHPSLRKPA